MVRPDIYSYSGPFGIVDSNRKLKSVLWLVRDLHCPLTLMNRLNEIVSAVVKFGRFFL